MNQTQTQANKNWLTVWTFEIYWTPDDNDDELNDQNWFKSKRFQSNTQIDFNQYLKFKI